MGLVNTLRVHIKIIENRFQTRKLWLFKVGQGLGKAHNHDVVSL